MDKFEARDKLNAYRERISRVTNAEHRAEYEQIAKGLRHLERGRKLIDMATVFADCPMDDKGRPKLAIFRADQAQVKVSNDHRSGVNGWHFHSVEWRRRAASLNMRFSSGGRETNMGYRDGYALVPIVPIEHRPARFDASKHFILWEVEEWSDRQIGAKPDIDPFLLRHVGGSLYAILAEWDLTDIERAVLAGRALL